jgi:hypothetical protein
MATLPTLDIGQVIQCLKQLLNKIIMQHVNYPFIRLKIWKDEVLCENDVLNVALF